MVDQGNEVMDSVDQINENDGLENLSEVYFPTKQRSMEQILQDSNLTTIQMNVTLAAMLAVFVPSDAHIMTKILKVFRDVICFSPTLFTNRTAQYIYSIIVMIPSFLVIFTKRINNFGIFDRDTNEKAHRYLRKALNFFTIFVSLHNGIMIGVLLNRLNILNIVFVTFIIASQLTWYFSILELNYTASFGTDFNVITSCFVENSPMIIFSLYSILYHAINTKLSLIIYSSIILVCCVGILYSKFFTPILKNIGQRVVTTTIATLIFTITNLLMYFVPNKTVYWLSGAYIMTNAICMFEGGKSPNNRNKKSRKVNKGNNQTYDDQNEDTHVRRKLITLECQDIATLCVFWGGILFMTVFNAIAARQMPVSAPLPDFVHNIFKTGQEIRGSPVFLEMQFSNLLCVIYIAYLVICCFIVPDVSNTRKFLLLYGVACVIRAISFVITSMPAPCAGLPNCPCADPKELDRLRSMNPLKIALTWTFGFGMFAKLPQCGDLIISGHTMFMWMSTRWIIEVTSRALNTHTAGLVKLVSMYVFFVGIVYISLSRNHYTIDVWFGFLSSELIYYIYSLLETKIDDLNNTGVLISILRWFETRKIPLVKEDYYSDDSISTTEV